jgi:hypothetical protein
MNSLRWLARRRNGLVHYKAKTKKISELDWAADWVNFEDATRSCDAVPALLRELKKLDKRVNVGWLSSDLDPW